MIAVTGASGQVGSEVVRLLAADGSAVRAVEHRRSVGTPGVDVVRADFDDRQSVVAALQGVSTVVLVSPAVPAQEMLVVDAAVEAGVTHVVKATSKASPNSPVERRRGQAAIEQHLRGSRLAWTLLRSNAYQQNLLALAPQVRSTSSFVMSAGDGEVGMVDARDVAAVAAVVAAAPEKHAGRTYWPTGPALVTYHGVATRLSAALGTTVTYRAVGPEEHLGLMLSAGLPEPVARSNAEAFRLIADGDAAWVTDDVEVLTGVLPRSVDVFIAEHRPAFTG